MLQRLTAIVLQTRPYQEDARMVSLLTRERGLLSCFVKNKRQALPLFATMEAICFQSRSGLLYINEVATLLPPPQKATIAVLRACQWMRDCLLALPESAQDARVFDLCEAIVHRLEESRCPETLAHLFCLKLLLHEGVLTDRWVCPTCAAPARHYAEGEFSCEKHAVAWAIAFTEEEETLVQQLCASRSLAAAQEVVLSETLLMKLRHLTAKGGT